MTQPESRFALSSRSCAILQIAVDGAKELLANTTKRREFRRLFDSEFGNASTETRYQNLFEKVIIWLEDIPNLDLSHRVSDLRMVQLASAGILITIKLHCIDAQSEFDGFFERVENAFSSSLTASMKSSSISTERQKRRTLPQIQQTECRATIANLLQLASETTGAIAAQIEESLEGAREQDADTLMDMTSATAATATNIAPPERVTLLDDDAEQDNATVGPNDPEFIDYINEPLQDDGFGGPLYIPQLRVTSVSGKSFSIEATSAVEVDNEREAPADAMMEPSEGEGVLEKAAALEEIVQDSFVLEPLELSENSPYKRRRKRPAYDDRINLSDSEVRKQIANRADIVRTLEDDRVLVNRKLHGWETAVELLLHGSNVERLGNGLKRALSDALCLPRYPRQPELNDQKHTEDKAPPQIDVQDEQQDSHLDPHADPSYLSSINRTEKPEDLTEAPTETFDVGSTIPSESHVDAPSFEPSVSTVRAAGQETLPNVLEVTQEPTDVTCEGTATNMDVSKLPEKDICSVEDSIGEEPGAELSNEEEKSMEESTRVEEHSKRIAQAIRLNGKSYRNPSTGKLLPYIALKDLPLVGVCDEDYLPTVMSDLMILVRQNWINTTGIFRAHPLQNSLVLLLTRTEASQERRKCAVEVEIRDSKLRKKNILRVEFSPNDVPDVQEQFRTNLMDVCKKMFNKFPSGNITPQAERVLVSISSLCLAKELTTITSIA